MKRNNPVTSKEAYKSVSIEMLNTHHSKIIKALKELGSGSYEEIANYLQWDDKNRASGRLLEMERLGLVWKPGAKKLTKSGRNAFVYCLTNQPKTDIQSKPVSELSKPTPEIKNTVIQSALFP